MRGLRLVIVVLLTLFAKLTLAERLAIGTIQPDVTILLLVFISLRRGPITGTLVGFSIGLLQDLLVGHTLGMNMLAKSITGFLLGKLSDKLVFGGLLFNSAITAVAVLLHDFIYLLVFTGLDLPRVFRMFFTQSVPTALYSAVAAFLLIAITYALGGSGRPSSGDAESHA
jgi:rod shape-determining protein MreD